MTDDLPMTQVERLRTLAFATSVFQGSARAQRIWAAHPANLGQLPDTYVTADDGMSMVEGLVIGGQWDADAGWDFSGTLTVLADDGVILNVNGWMASSIEVL